MEQSFSWKKIQQIPRILWKKKVHYDVRRNPTLSYSLSQMKPIHAIPSIFWTSSLISFFHLCLGLASGLFHGSPPKPVCNSVLPYTGHMPHPSHMFYINIQGQQKWLSLKVCGEEHLNFKKFRHRSGLFSVTIIRCVKAIHITNRGSHEDPGPRAWYYVFSLLVFVNLLVSNHKPLKSFLFVCF